MKDEKREAIDIVAELEKSRSAKCDAVADEVCICCNEPVLSFANDLNRLMYEISGVCQNCQDDRGL